LIGKRRMMETDFLHYLAARQAEPGARLPPIPELARQLGISTGKLREQLEVARHLGLIDVKPKTGIRTRAYNFTPALSTSINFALTLSPDYFGQLGLLRNHIEAAFWFESVSKLTDGDKSRLAELCAQAWGKLRGDPVQIPHAEHRDLHLTIYSRLENVFVRGLLEVYWEAYEAIGLNLYADYGYLNQVWSYHQEMVQSIIDGDMERGYQALVEHTGLLQARPEISATGLAATSPGQDPLSPVHHVER
jgi:DNA-binding FadR family transcriptional regulator